MTYLNAAAPGLAVLLDGGDAWDVGAALVQLSYPDGDGVARIQKVPLVLFLVVFVIVLRRLSLRLLLCSSGGELVRDLIRCCGGDHLGALRDLLRRHRLGEWSETANLPGLLCAPSSRRPLTSPSVFLAYFSASRLDHREIVMRLALPYLSSESKVSEIGRSALGGSGTWNNILSPTIRGR